MPEPCCQERCRSRQPARACSTSSCTRSALIATSPQSRRRRRLRSPTRRGSTTLPAADNAGPGRAAVPVDHHETVGIDVDAQSLEQRRRRCGTSRGRMITAFAQPPGRRRAPPPSAGRRRRTSRTTSPSTTPNPTRPVRNCAPVLADTPVVCVKNDDIVGPLPDELGVHHRTGVHPAPREVDRDLPPVAVTAVQDRVPSVSAHTGCAGRSSAYTRRHQDRRANGSPRSRCTANPGSIRVTVSSTISTP